MTDIFTKLSQHSKKTEDARGSLEVLYEKGNLVLKRSFSKKGVFRGMHLQLPPHTQTKLIRVVTGRIIDFVVEPKNKTNTIYWQEIDAASDWIEIDSKFAHGFYAVEDTVFEYICDGAYNEAAERSYSIADFIEQTFGIEKLVLSEKDAQAIPLKVHPSGSTS